MTKNEVLDFINQCENCNEKPFGYMVVAISKEDIAVHAPALCDKMNEMTEDEKVEKLSEIADKLNDKFENECFGDFMKEVTI